MNSDSIESVAEGTPRRPGLLVSVRSLREAAAAVAGGADLIDVKEPANGPLGAAAADVMEAVATEIGAVRPVSVALGEMYDLKPHLCEAMFHMPPIQYAKLGLAGAGEVVRWWHTWEQVWSRLPRGIGRVGVIYADWQVANTPPPEQVLAVFASTGCNAVLIDTFAKGGPSLVDCVPQTLLSVWVELARAAAPMLVLAGSLSIASLGPLRVYQPDYVAVRGAACRGGRSGRVSRTQTRKLAAALRTIL